MMRPVVTLLTINKSAQELDGAGIMYGRPIVGDGWLSYAFLGAETATLAVGGGALHYWWGIEGINAENESGTNFTNNPRVKPTWTRGRREPARSLYLRPYFRWKASNAITPTGTLTLSVSCGALLR